ncbi:MAG: VOC family protein [Fermentimonas sp.]|nr:VOC family protein [Fermentimonas sp.]
MIYPCIWCNNNAREMADFYLSVFRNSEIGDVNDWVVVLKIDGQRIMLLNGGEMFQPNPSISLMYLTTSEIKVEDLYQKLNVDAKVLMPLDSYPFSSKYAWVEDRYGVSWQIITAEEKDIIQKIVPTLMFVGENNGKALGAIDYYTSVFPDSEKRGVLKYTGEEGETPGNVQHAEFKILNYLLMIMDSSYPHKFNFSAGVSLVIECETQQDIDNYWNVLTSNGGEEGMCGWLKDKFGVSWQITPTTLKELLVKSPKVMEVMMTMKKLDIHELSDAAT